MNDADLFVVVRRSPASDRYISLAMGWMNNPQHALTFASRAAAERVLNGRPGEIVPAPASALKLMPPDPKPAARPAAVHCAAP